MEFSKVSETGLPKVPGRYLVKYYDADNEMKPDYAILCFKEFEDIDDGSMKLGFFYNQDCPPSAGFEGPVYKNKVFEYILLPEI